MLRLLQKARGIRGKIIGDFLDAHTHQAGLLCRSLVLELHDFQLLLSKQACRRLEVPGHISAQVAITSRCRVLCVATPHSLRATPVQALQHVTSPQEEENAGGRHVSAAAGSGAKQGSRNKWRRRTSHDPDTLIAHSIHTKRIKLCSNWQELRKVVAMHAHQFNHVNTAAAIVHLAQRRGAPQQPLPGSSSTTDSAAWNAYAAYEELLQQLLQMVSSKAAEMGARQVANCMWAAAKLSAGYTGGHPMCQAVVQQLLDQQGSYMLPWLNSKELSMSLWAVASAGLEPTDSWLAQFVAASETVLMRSLQASPQDLCMLVWGFATLSVAPDHEWLAAFLGRTRQLLPQLTHRDAAQILAALARLEINLATVDAPLMAALRQLLLQTPEQVAGAHAHGTAAANTASSASWMTVDGGLASQHDDRWDVSLSQGLWALARMLDVPPTYWMQQAFNQMESCLQQFGAQELSTSLWAAVTLGQPLPSSLVRAVYAATLADAQSHHGAANTPQPPMLVAGFTAQGLAELLWAISIADQSHSVRGGAAVTRPLVPPPTWTTAYLNTVLAQLPSASDQAVAMMLVAAARLRITPPPEWIAQVLHHISTQPRCSEPQALGNIMWAVAKMGYTVNHEGVVALEAKLLASLQHASSEQEDEGRKAWASQELSQVLFAYAKWQRAPSEGVLQGLLHSLQVIYTTSAQQHARSSMPLLPQELSNTLWALQQLNIQPSEEWLGSFWAAACIHMSAFNSKDLSQLAYSLAKMGRAPVHPAVLAANAVASKPSTGASSSPAPQSHDYTLDPADCMTTPQHEASASSVLSPSRSRSPATVFASGLPSRGLLSGTESDDEYDGDLSRTDSLHQPIRPARSTTPLAALTPKQCLPALRSMARDSSTRVQDWAAPLLREAMATFGKCSGQDLANLSWGLAQLGVRPSQEWSAKFAEQLRARGSALEGRHLATCVWALGKLGHEPAPQSLLPLEGALFRKLPSMAPRELAACIWGFAAMSYVPDVEWLEALANQCMIMAAQFSQQEWSVVVYSLANIVEANNQAEVYLEDLFLSPQLNANIAQFGPSGLAILMYACGMLGTRSPKLMASLCGAATQHMSAFSAPEMSALIMSCARMGQVPDATFFKAWSLQIRTRMAAAEQAFLAAPIEPAWEQPSAGRKKRQSRSTDSARGFGSNAVVARVSESQDPVASVAAAAAESVSEAQRLAMTSLATDSSAGAGTSSPAVVLPASVLAVSAYALASLRVRPSDGWFTLFCRVVTHQATWRQLGHKELVMLTYSVNQWKMPVPRAFYDALKALFVHHKPLLSQRERHSVQVSLHQLKAMGFGTPPPNLTSSSATAIATPAAAAAVTRL